MIQFFIRIANNWVGKLIFGFLLFGMVFVLGYGGLVEQGRRPDRAVTVGDEALSMQQLDAVFRQETKNLSQMMGGQYISPKQAMEMGLLDNVVHRQVNEMIMAEIKDNLGLTASNKAVQKYVENNPAFADATGKFDRNLFTAYLRQSRMNERELGKKLQDELATRHLTHAIQGLSYAPDSFVKQSYRRQNETRDVTALFVETDKIKLDRSPTEEDLRNYYDVYATDRYMTPEYRSFSYLYLTPETLLGRVQVSDSEVDSVFEERKNQFQTPEKRLVSQMFFADEESARQMISKVTPDNFDKLASEELKQTPDITDFGYVSSNELADNLSEAVFAASKGKIVGPVAGNNGFHLLLVKDIKAATITPDTEIRAQLKKQLAQEKVYGLLEEVTRQLEDILGEGKNLSQAATELKLPLKTVTAIDISGVQKDGKEVPAEAKSSDLIQNLFTLKVGESTPLFEVTSGTIVAELTDIIPTGTKSFDEVRSDLVRLWQTEQRQEALQKTADQIADRVKSGSSLQTQSLFSHFDLIKAPALKRNHVEQLPLNVLQNVFQQKQGTENLKQTSTDKGIYLTLVNKVYYPKGTKDEETLKGIRESVREQTGVELLNGFVASYADTIGVSVNEEEIKKFFSIYTKE